MSHCVWAGVRSDPSRCVVFAAPSSAPRVSGQISSHVIAVFISKLQQIASCVPVLEASIGKKLVPGVLHEERKTAKSKPLIKFAAWIPTAVRYGQGNLTNHAKIKLSLKSKGKSTVMTSKHLLECLFSPEEVKSPNACR